MKKAIYLLILILAPTLMLGQNVGDSINVGIPTLNRKVSVHPNPAKTNINVGVHIGITYYALYDFKGSEVLNGTTTVGNMFIDVSTLASGAYVLRLFGKDPVLTSKIIIQ